MYIRSDEQLKVNLKALHCTTEVPAVVLVAEFIVKVTDFRRAVQWAATCSCHDTRVSVFQREACAVNMRHSERRRSCMHVPRHVCITWKTRREPPLLSLMQECHTGCIQHSLMLMQAIWDVNADECGVVVSEWLHWVSEAAPDGSILLEEPDSVATDCCLLLATVTVIELIWSVCGMDVY